MSTRRVLKVAEAIREVVSMAILIELRDPRVENVTVTYVEVSKDLRNAKVHVSVMGEEKKQQLCLAGLRHSAGYLQQKIGKRLDTRYIPRLQFVLDQGVKHSLAVARILEDVLPQDQGEQKDATSEPAPIESEPSQVSEITDVNPASPHAESAPEAASQQDSSPVTDSERETQN